MNLVKKMSGITKTMFTRTHNVIHVLLTATCLLVLCSSVFANMELSNVILHFEAGEPNRQDVEISNSGNEPLYVEIVPTMVISPGDANEDRSSITDPRQAGLLVTPNKLIVPPGGTKAVRFVKLGPSLRERVYRIAAVPVTNAVTADQSGLKILIGYEILAIVYPNNPRPNIVAQRIGRKFTVRNNGNANVLFREGYQCEQRGQNLDECTPLPGKRLYPGNEWAVELPYDLPVTYYQSTGSKNFVERYE